MQALGYIWGDVNPRDPHCEEIRTFLPGPVHVHGRFLEEFWRKRMQDDGFVVGRDLPSRHLSHALRNLSVLEPLGGGKDYRIRVAGMAMLRRFGHDVTGCDLSDVFSGAAFVERRSEISTMLASSTPYAVDVKIPTEEHRQQHFEVVGVPALSPDRKTAWAVMGVFYYDWLR
jgi:hypothetical protein